MTCPGCTVEGGSDKEKIRYPDTMTAILCHVPLAFVFLLSDTKITMHLMNIP